MFSKKTKLKILKDIISVLVFIAFMLWVIKGCNYLSGATRAGVFQRAQIQMLGVPPNTKLVEVFQPHFTKTIRHNWLSSSYETTLSEKQIFDYYHQKLTDNLWEKMRLVSSAFHWDKMDKPSFNTQDHHLDITFTRPNPLPNKLIYVIKIEWGKLAELENIKSNN